MVKTDFSNTLVLGTHLKQNFVLIANMKIISKKIDAEIDELSYLNIYREVYLNLETGKN